MYAFVLSGQVAINGQPLGKRDGLGIWEVSDFEVAAEEPSKVLLMEVPMKF